MEPASQLGEGRNKRFDHLPCSEVQQLTPAKRGEVSRNHTVSECLLFMKLYILGLHKMSSLRDPVYLAF